MMGQNTHIVGMLREWYLHAHELHVNRISPLSLRHVAAEPGVTLSPEVLKVQPLVINLKISHSMCLIKLQDDRATCDIGCI